MKTEQEIREKIVAIETLVSTFEDSMNNDQHHGYLMQIKMLNWVLEA